MNTELGYTGSIQCNRSTDQCWGEINVNQCRSININTHQYNQCNTDQCRSIQINTDQYRSLQCYTDQCRSIQINTDQYRSLQCNTDQCKSKRSIKINTN